MNASFGGLGVDSNGDLISKEAGNVGDEVNGITKYGGSFSTAALDGTTAATLGEGSITVRNETAEATRERLASVNRDLDNLTTITRDSSFDTGDIDIDVGALSRVKENLGVIREYNRAIKIEDLQNKEELSTIEYEYYTRANAITNGKNDLSELSDADKAAYLILTLQYNQAVREDECSRGIISQCNVNNQNITEYGTGAAAKLAFLKGGSFGAQIAFDTEGNTVKLRFIGGAHLGVSAKLALSAYIKQTEEFAKSDMKITWNVVEAEGTAGFVSVDGNYSAEASLRDGVTHGPNAEASLGWDALFDDGNNISGGTLQGGLGADVGTTGVFEISISGDEVYNALSETANTLNDLIRRVPDFITHVPGPDFESDFEF